VSTTVTEQIITTTVSGTVITTTVTPQQITAGVVDGGVTHHALLSGLGADDHPHYLTQARGDARYWPLATDLATQAELDAWTAAHLVAADPHPQYLTPAEAGVLYWPLAIDLATQAELDAWTAAHLAASDPHPQYLTSAEAGLLYAALSHTHDDRYYTESESDALLAGKAAASHTHPWGQITGTPTTLSGYGITDAAPAAAEYLTLAAHAGLSAERVLTAGTNITLDASTPGQLVISAAGGGGGTIDGSGTAGRVAQWSDSDTLQAANLIAPANLLTLIAAGAYSLTIPATGTAALLGTNNLFSVRQDIRASGAGAASGLYVPWITGDAAPTLTVGSPSSSNNTTCLYAETGSGTALDLRAWEGGVAANLLLSNTQTSNVRQIIVAQRRSSGTPAAGFGQRWSFNLQSSTSNNQLAGALDVLWANATHASRAARMALLVGDSTGLREALRLDATGSGVTLDAYGTTSISKDTSGSTDTFLSLKKASARNWDARIDPGGNLVLQPDGYASLILPAFNGSAPVQTWQNNSGSTVAQVDQTTSSNETPLLLLADGSVRRVKVGAAGTGPGGSGRALYMD
jgi:hypothetical protein